MLVYFILKGGTIGCFKRAAKYAPVALDEINSVFSEEENDLIKLPLSCTAILAKKMGLSERQITMAAGLAGGIGLSGGACGALGAAIWMISMQQIEEGDAKLDFKDPKAVEAIERFQKCTDYEFECREIVGKKFESVEEHATYIQNGGCSEIIDILARD
jgi:hypothetical protein